jgi:hypothetical protein
VTGTDGQAAARPANHRVGLSMALICSAQFAHADVHEPAREAIPVPALAECQLRQC